MSWPAGYHPMSSSPHHRRLSNDRSHRSEHRFKERCGRTIRSGSRLVGSPSWREVAVRGIRGVTVTALSALVTVALVGLLGTQVPTLPAAAAVTPTWQTTAGYTPLANVSAVSCAPNATASTTTCVAVGDNGGNVASIIVTQNGGTTWSDSTPPSSVTSLSTVSCPSSAVCYAGGDAGIMKSSDGGASWTIQASTFPT